MPMEALDQVRMKDECDDYELGHLACVCVHQDICNKDEYVQYYSKSMNPIVGVLQSPTATKSVMIWKRSHKDFYSADSGGSLRKGD